MAKTSLILSTVERIKRFSREHRVEFILLIIILLLASFLRLYRISEYMTFLGDEGRDSIIVRRFLVNGDIFLIGPGTSIGNMYLGPLYYYMMAPALLLAAFSPVGPAVQIAVLGVVTVFLIWHIAREWFGSVAGVVASVLYAISPTVIIYSRSSWNPNIMPFFALLCIYCMWKVWVHKRYLWLLVLGVSMAFVLQSHYMGLLLAPTLGVIWGAAAWQARKNKNLKTLLKYTLMGLGIFLVLMSPLVIFDARHNWQNFSALSTFFLDRQTTISARPWNALPNIWPLLQDITTRLLTGRVAEAGKWVAMALLLGMLFMLKDMQKKKWPKVRPIVYLSLWLGVALIGLGVYKQHIYDHYYGFFFAAPFLLFGGICSYFVEKAKLRGAWIVGTVLLFLVFFSFQNSPLTQEPNSQLKRTRIIAEFIRDEANNETFNLAVIAERNYEAAYQYFLEKWRAKVIEIDPLRADETIESVLYVVCELPPEKCDPTNNPKAQVANFGWSKIDKEWNVEGHTVFKLVHTK